MKKFIIVLLIVVCTLPFYSCKKEGIYNPKKKIERIYEQIPGSSKQLTQIWNWKKNKLLSIDHYSADGTLSWVAYYEYDGKRINAIANYENNQKTVFTYDGNKIKAIEYWDNTALTESYSFTYKGNKISSYTRTVLDSKEPMTQCGKELIQCSLQLFLPEDGIETMQESCSFVSDTKGKSYIFDIEWDGDNVKKMSNSNNHLEISYQYDDKKSPYCGFYGLYSPYIEYYSKNNIIQYVITIDDISREVVSSYIYEDNYPVQKTLNDKLITFYEYLK